MNYLKNKKSYLALNNFLNNHNYFKLFNKYIKPFLLDIFICLLSIMIFTSANLIYPYIIELVIDDALVNKSINKLFIYTFSMFFIVIIQSLSRYFVANKSLTICQKIILKIKEDITEQLSKYSQIFFGEYKRSQIISVIENDLQQIERVGIYIITEFLVSVITIIGLLIIIFVIDYHIAIVCIALLILYAYLQKNNGKKLKSYSLGLSKSKGELYSHTQELVFNISDIKMLNYHHQYKKNYLNKCIEYFKKEKRITNLGVWSNIVGIVFNNLTLIIALCLGGYMMLNEEMTVGILFSLTVYTQQLFSPVTVLTNLYVELKKIQASLKRVSNILHNKKYVIQEGYKSSEQPLYGDIILKDFSFSYGKEIIFNKANINIENRSKIALIGSNGSGKTTLIRLLMRLQEDYQGEILLDGCNIEDYKLDYLRENIICISQRPFILNGTILDNILLNNKELTEEKVNEIISLVCLTDDIKNMPNGINTVIGDNGISLSGGQAQKLALARIFVNDYSIIILDEPTSALDIESEEIICKNIYQYLNDKTIIAVTHRKTILKYCSPIYEVKNNLIIEKTLCK
ncbi:ABC transporter transmembrane domain-containing protein [Clostridium sp. 1001275B_160808_H3]|uniref:ABC transporter ATP-binding protein n=1 Tax=Clostridium sp. 1001275B_160808_H3 TaxID=2787110 RepID=UPI001897F237|nr:ABC transporter transmembrane domain-containing protein [Clostridium sp. 1001275B_160808_H3]